VQRSYVTALRKGRIENPGFEKLRAIAKAMNFPPELWFEDVESLGEASGAWPSWFVDREDKLALLDEELVEALRDETARAVLRRSCAFRSGSGGSSWVSCASLVTSGKRPRVGAQRVELMRYDQLRRDGPQAQEGAPLVPGTQGAEPRAVREGRPPRLHRLQGESGRPTFALRGPRRADKAAGRGEQAGALAATVFAMGPRPRGGAEGRNYVGWRT
jgi:hypothetical protein